MATESPVVKQARWRAFKSLQLRHAAEWQMLFELAQTDPSSTLLAPMTAKAKREVVLRSAPELEAALRAM